MGFFGFVDKLKQLIGINKEVVEQKAEELEEEGYSITDIQDEEMEIEVPQGENIEEVLEKVYEEDLTTRKPPEPYNIFYYEYSTKADGKECPACKANGEEGTLELQIDPTGSVHTGADEKKIEHWLDYKWWDILKNPRKDWELAHRLHEYRGLCRCTLKFTGESYSN